MEILFKAADWFMVGYLGMMALAFLWRFLGELPDYWMHGERSKDFWLYEGATTCSVIALVLWMDRMVGWR